MQIRWLVLVSVVVIGCIPSGGGGGTLRPVSHRVHGTSPRGGTGVGSNCLKPIPRSVLS